MIHRTRPSSRLLLVLLVIASFAAALALSPSPAQAASSSTPAAADPPLVPPKDDPFYQPPSGYEQREPGTVLRKREISAYTYGIKVPAKAYQILVRSTDAHGKAIANVSTVFVPLTPPIGQRNLLSFQIATDSLGTQCNPSYRLRQGLEKEVTGIYTALSAGWAAVITDYQGPKMAWTAGRVAGHSVLDGIRGTLRLPEAGLTPTTPVGAWGYSGGGQATAWAAQLHPTYAPELNVKGFAAGAFPGDIKLTLKGLDGGPFAGFVVGGGFGLIREYPALQGLLSDAGRKEAARVGDLCQIALVASNPFAKLSPLLTVDPYTDPTTNAVFADNRIGGQAPTAPVLIQQSALDEIIRPEFNQGSYRDWCAGGATVEYRLTYVPGHVGYALGSIPGAFAWLTDRFAGKPAKSTCG
ncbi:lipase family protein [Luteipulveratus mongoliensis]|uniref:Triacylglycerol lipase n=1 Tax=Luteipulveratus mongoliensis TaxID=571913 RepID=A0A0K1JNE8_9MICO|nr:lipase family protein [Luteipulveratus mongoliensis]AKU18232.1 hypothetical protein VV02_24225 [Luteipulveratus mongoliensis]